MTTQESKLKREIVLGIISFICITTTITLMAAMGFIGNEILMISMTVIILSFIVVMGKNITRRMNAEDDPAEQPKTSPPDTV